MGAARRCRNGPPCLVVKFGDGPHSARVARGRFYSVKLWRVLRLAIMPDDNPAPIPFTVDVTVDRTRVQVTLLLRPGTAVTVADTKTTTEPTPKDHDG